MASVRKLFGDAVRAYREACGHLDAAAGLAGDTGADPVYGAQSITEQAALVAQLQEVTEQLTPGWWTASWDAALGDRELGVEGMAGRTSLVRLGTAYPVDQGFGVIVPFLGAGHLSVDADGRDPRVAGFLRGVLLRVLAATPPGSVRVLGVDGGTLGTTFTPLRPLIAARLMAEPAIDLNGYRTVLTEAEQWVQRRQEARREPTSLLLVVIAAFPTGMTRADIARLAALAHVGVSAGVHLVVAGYPLPPAPGLPEIPPLQNATTITSIGENFAVSDPPGGGHFSARGRGLSSPVVLDQGPPSELVASVCARIAALVADTSQVRFADLVPQRLATESSVNGLSVPIGRQGHAVASLMLDDATPHWLVGGRTGSGKTVFLMNALYSMVARYGPDELALYLLDFKEGVSFTEFTPTQIDPTWIPHARAVGVESDREYGVAVLEALTAEMGRRATVMKRLGVTSMTALRTARTEVAMPRIVTVIDEFHVLFAGNDGVARRASALLEEVARKGRSYGVHLILASQTTAGIEALFAKGEAIFGQFGQRVALAGGGGVLGSMNQAADDLERGEVIVNDAGGVLAANRRVRFPDTDAELMASLRTQLWRARVPGAQPPAQFAGYAEQHLEDDPTFATLSAEGKRVRALVGRNVDLTMTTAAFAFDASPGRHLAILGPSVVGASVLHAAAVSAAVQHEPGEARFIVAGLVAASDEVVDDTVSAIQAAGQQAEVVDANGLRTQIGMLTHSAPGEPTYLVIFGADAASGVLKGSRDASSGRTGLDDLRWVLQQGPANGLHVLGWWRGVRRLLDDLGPQGKDDIAGIVALNVAANELGSLLGEYSLNYTPRENRALLVDRHEHTRSLIVPFLRPGLGGHS